MKEQTENLQKQNLIFIFFKISLDNMKKKHNFVMLIRN